MLKEQHKSKNSTLRKQIPTKKVRIFHSMDLTNITRTTNTRFNQLLNIHTNSIFRYKMRLPSHTQKPLANTKHQKMDSVSLKAKFTMKMCFLFVAITFIDQPIRTKPFILVHFSFTMVGKLMKAKHRRDIPVVNQALDLLHQPV